MRFRHRSLNAALRDVTVGDGVLDITIGIG